MNRINSKVEIVPDLIKKCPVVFEWWKHKGNVVFAGLNFDKSIQTGKPWVDLHYCATKALNGIVEKTVIYREKDFVPHIFSSAKQPQNENDLNDITNRLTPYESSCAPAAR